MEGSHERRFNNQPLSMYSICLTLCPSEQLRGPIERLDSEHQMGRPLTHCDIEYLWVVNGDQ